MPDGKRAILIDARIHLSAKVAALPTHSSRWAFIVLLCEAKWQDTPGRFKSPSHLNACLDGLKTEIRNLLAVGLLEHDGDGYAVHDWDNWQHTSDATAAERMRRYRERRRGPGGLRVEIEARDANACRYCGKETKSLILEHVDPRGPNDASNLVLACHACNQRKGSRLSSETGMTLLPEPLRRPYVVNT